MSDINEYQAAVRYVESFSNISLRKNFGKDRKDPGFFLRRTRYFLGLLGNPEKGFSYIHVTGTAGKGTVSSMLQEVLAASGKKTGLFTSPYVTTTVEKIRVDGSYIYPDELVTWVDYLRPFIALAAKGPYGSPSAFEIFLAVAFLHFKKQKCEWIVLEVGLGGRYDATNVIAHPVVTTITNIDYDHTEILGKTLREIATDKAGIIKPGSSFFTSEQRPAIQNIFRKICRKVKADFHAVSRQAHYSLYNKELVRAIVLSLGISPEDIEKGISRTRLPCRFEVMERKPKQPMIVLDGAHNRAKIRSTVSNIKKLNFNRLFLVLAIADSKKDQRAILEPLFSMPYPMHAVLTQVKTSERRSISPDLLFSFAKRYKKNKTTLEVVDDAHAALGHVLKMASEDDLVVVTGSLFLAGELRKEWVSEEWVLENGKSFKD